MAETLSWKFPLKEVKFLRIEIFFLIILGILIFLYTAFQFERRLFSGLIFSLLFIIIYIFVAFGMKKMRKIEEHYKVSGRHLHITHKTRKKTGKVKIPLSSVSMHKFDRFFLGGYVVTIKNLKHVLYFNTRKEMEKFEKLLRKHLKPA